MTSSKNPAEVRGDIQRGRTGDKRPGFDPAAAPLETDSEAGASALSPEQIAMSRESGAALQTGSADTDSYNEAMRREERPVQTDSRSGRLIIYLVVAVVAAMAVAAVALFGIR